jgi:peptidoglycan/xylan/chitin deacetylase (PgdA/CDA1 family)
MSKRETWLACGAVAVALPAMGFVLDRLLGTTVLLTLAGAALGALYLLGTFGKNAPVFGRVTRVRAEPGRLALTFDDGPDPRYTAEISRRLAERGHRATFFVLGAQASKHPDVLRQLVADGHEVASHGFDHTLLAFSAPRRVYVQLDATEDAVAAATGSPPTRLFRAPHGVRSPWLRRATARRGYRLCGWTGSIFDTANPGPPTIVERARRHLRPGSTLLLHDGDGSGRGADRRQTLEALEGILDEAERRGLRSVPLSSLVEPPLPVLDLDRCGHRRALPEAGDRQALAGERDQAQAQPD